MAVKPGDSAPDGYPEAVCEHKGVELPSVKFCLAPHFADDFACPAWAIKGSSDAKDVNVAWGLVSVAHVAVVDA